jgi:hypothetical protein
MKYYVIVRSPRPFYYAKGYTLKNAKAFARIGSQRRKSGVKAYDRVIVRGNPRGQIVRVYSDGKRVWPLFDDQLIGLRAAEIPSDLK